MTTMPTQGADRSGVYTTPEPFIAAVKALLRIDHFTIDLASDASNAKAARYFDEAADALAQDWTAYASTGWAWLNPPFFNITPWVAKAAASGINLAVLVPASVGAEWFAEYVDGKALVLALRGRLAFIEGRPDLIYPKDCILALYGCEPGFRVWDWRQEISAHSGQKLLTP